MDKRTVKYPWVVRVPKGAAFDIVAQKRVLHSWSDAPMVVRSQYPFTLRIKTAKRSRIVEAKQ